MTTNSIEPDDLKADVLGQFLEELEVAADAAGLVRHYASAHPQWAEDFAEEAALSRILVTSRDALEPGDLAELPDFQIKRVVASGGMGIVYEAEQISLGRRVALKVRHGRPSPERQVRFRCEQQTLARLHQSHIVPIHLAGECDGWQYFAMAYIEGASLHVLAKTALQHVITSKAPLPSVPELIHQVAARPDTSTSALTQWTASLHGGNTRKMAVAANTADSLRPLTLSQEYFRSVARLIADAADALAFAHDADVVHRDIKPSNIMVDVAGHCWLIDFGLAYHSRPETSDGHHSESRANGQTIGPMGTPEYMAPEQHQSPAANAAADPRSDVWGLGATLYEMLALQRPFSGQTYQEIKERVHTEDPTPLQSLVHNVPADLAAIARKALQRDPSKRYQRADEMAADLRRWLKGEPTTARPARLARSVWMWARRNPGWAAALTATLIGCAFAALLLILHLQTAAREAEFRALTAQEREREQERKTQLQRRESLMIQAQRLQLAHANNGWSDQAWDLVRQAGEIQRDERVRDLAADCLLGLDARLVKRFPIPGSTAAFSADGKRLLIGGVERTSYAAEQIARIWHSEGDREALSTLPGEGPVGFDAQGTALQLVMSTKRDKLILWDVQHGKALREFALPASKSSADAELALSPGAKHVAVSIGKQTIIWEVGSDQPMVQFSEHADAIAFSAKSDLVALAESSQKRVVLWSLVNKKVVAELPTSVVATTSLAFGELPRRSLDPRKDERNELLAIGDSGGTITIWNLRTRQPTAYCRGSARDVFALAFSPDGTLLASGGREEARIWNVATGQTMLRIHDKNGMDYITGLAFTSDGRQLAICSRGVFYPPGVTVWNLTPTSGLQTLHGLSGQIEMIALSPDGRQLAALAHNWEVGLWDLGTGHLRVKFEVPPGVFTDGAALAFSPDGRHLAYSVGAQYAGEARLWSTDSCREVKRWKLPPGLLNKAVFGDAGQLWHFQVEIQSGAALPSSALRWQDHPRVCRVRNLNDGDGVKVVAEIPDFNRHVFMAVAAQSGRHVILEGTGTQPKVGRWLKIIDLPTGNIVWSRDIERKSKSAHLVLEPSGKAFYYTPTEAVPAIRTSVPTGEPCSTLPNMAEAACNGGSFVCRFHETAKLSCYVCKDNDMRSAVRFSPNTDIVAATFGRSQDRFAWGGRDGSVVVCDLPAVHAKLAQLGLAW